MTAEMKYNLWLQQVPSGSEIHKELESIQDQPGEISARFAGDLTFGTAGLRGIMGAGTDRMNVYTVRRAALAYGQYIRESSLPNTCVIAYDTRNNGELFSQTCAVALAEQGIQVSLFREPTPTPVLSFAVRHLGTGGGVVMTASHNPAPYNGMKCYGNDGCQQTDEPAAVVYANMEKLPMISESPLSFETLVAEGKIRLIYDEVYESYYQAVLKEAICTGIIPVSGLKVLYTPLHGTGLKPVTHLFDTLGVQYDLVPSQKNPDGYFSTCPYPNPENAEAFDEARKVIAQSAPGTYDLIVATDPDADRVAVAVPQADGSIHRISGNELGCMLLEFILNNRLRLGTLPAHSKCIKSIVTTPMVNRIAEQYGCQVLDVLTGFKYIGSTILGLEQQGMEQDVVFSYEESCGYLKGTYARDKDAQIAAVMVCLLAAACKLEGMNLSEKLRLMYRKYGFYKCRSVSVTLDGEKGKQLCSDFIDALRNAPPAEIAGIHVATLADYRCGLIYDLSTGTSEKLDFPSSNVLSFQLVNDCKVVLRPSGTEPKLKIYYFAVAEEEAEAERILSELTGNMGERMHNFGID